MVGNAGIHSALLCHELRFNTGCFERTERAPAIEVYDKETQRDRLIGKADYLINNDLLSTVDEKHTMIEIFDSKGRSWKA